MTAPPECLIERPADGRCLIRSPASRSERPLEPRTADPLSAVLAAVRLRGAVYFRVDASAPWALQAPPGRALAPAVMPAAQHLIEYHVVRRGSCFGGLIGEPLLELRAGDVIVFPQGDPHVLSNARAPRRATSTESDEVAAMLRRASPPFPIRTGGGREGGAEVVCGFLGCDMRPFNPLIEALPRVLHVRAEPGDAVLKTLIELTLVESGANRAGGECTLARLSELMFIEIVRRYLETSSAATGWLSGLRDPVVGRALTLLHGDPVRAWTIESLARAAHLSRSALAERFRRLIGQPPMQYLAHWRMQLAAGLLNESHGTVAAVASAVGYGSEAAFSRAFKKLVGASPSEWREHGRR